MKWARSEAKRIGKGKIECGVEDELYVTMIMVCGNII